MNYKSKIFNSWFTIVLLLSSCAGLQFKYATLNHAGHVDGIYNSTGNVKIDTLSYSQFKWKIQNNFQFRYDYAQYALSQPLSFDWNNRLLGTRYNWNSPYWSYNYYWNRTQMWHDWVWGFSSPHRWSYLDMIDGDIIIGWAMSIMVGIVIMAGMDTTMTGTGDGE